MIFAQVETPPGFLENETLDRWVIPLGEWFDQIVDWIDNNLGTLLDIIEWPFDTLISWLVDDVLLSASWFWVVLAMGLIASLTRNIKVGAFVMAALTICGLLGEAYWIETARTIGFIAVAVIICVIIGIPIGIAAGRMDGVWQTARPLLDAMQVVHSFVYMIPFIFFWGIGEVSATMVTMIFAIPPLIRLTNLGIRQVPEDVVEAARAHGAPEWRVLLDVQIPLARPAIMTGINQTLLLAISMLGIAAIMGAGGLGRLLFRSLSNQDVALAASAGMAFFLVAVVLDRISQRDDDAEANLFTRIHRAWAHRRDPEALLPDGEATDRVQTERYEPFGARERTAMLVTAIGGILAVVAVFLPWTENAGKISAYGTRADEDLPGMVFNGLDASGGSFFGFIVFLAGLFVVASVVVVLLRPGRGPRWMTVDGALIAAFAALITAGAHLLAEPAPLASDPGTGIGVLVAVAGGLVASVGSTMWISAAPHLPLHPLSPKVSWGRLIGVGVAFILVVAGAFGGWSFDERSDVVLTPELEAEIAELEAEAEADPAQAAVIAGEIAALVASAQATGTIITDGVTDDGAGLGIWSMLVALVAVGTSLPAAGVLGPKERRLWSWSAVTAGLGAGVAAIAIAWIFTFVRNGDPNFIAGVGAFLSMLGGAFIVASTMSVLKEFRRSKVYDDEPKTRSDATYEAEELTEQLV
ncbi:MAG: ABC transporter permease [Acidimicrobiia bacterium]